MRTSLVVGVAALALAGSIQAAEARGRGFGRLFSGKAPTRDQPVATTSAAGTRPDATRISRIGLRPAIATAPAAASAVAPVVAVPQSRATGEPASAASRSVNTPAPHVQEARVAVPACTPERRVGGVGDSGTGFCLIN